MTVDGVESKEFTEYRGYLQFLARLHLSARYRGKLDQSDIVQQSLLQAFTARAQFQGQTEAERLAWLRQILIHNIEHATRGLHTKKRDINREQPLKAALDGSSTRLGNFLAAKGSSPSQQIVRQENIRILAAAIERLSEEQRQVVILRYWNEMSLQELAESLGKSTSAVAGLLHRATKKLRSLLDANQT